MELSSSNIKKILTFSQGKGFPIFCQKGALLIFSQKKAFLYSEKKIPSLFSQYLKNKNVPPQKTDMELSYLLENGTFEPQA